MDEIYARINDDIEIISNASKAEGPHQIRDFYTGKTLFLTGCTGYIGKCVIEKLLRTCYGIEKIFILVRPKKNSSVEDRMAKFFQNVLFDKLRNTRPGFEKKVVPLQGDLMEPGLGLSPELRQLLIEETDIIIHNGATVMFTEQISVALKINVLATKEMLDLASECRHVKAFMYVSTAYSHCYRKNIGDEFYRPPADIKMVYDMLQADKETVGLTEDALKVAFGEWPNTYTFTKATAESLVEQYARKLPFPCCVFRPSIVCSTYKEPLQNWSGNTNGPVVFFLGFGLGLIHVILMNDEIVDLVPVDMTSNGLLAVIWDVAENRKDSKEASVYNYCSSTTNPLSLRHIKLFNGQYPYPSVKSFWYIFVVSVHNHYAFNVLHILFHFLPALFADIGLLVQGKKPMLLQTYFRIQKNFDKIWYFMLGDWRIKSDNLQKLWDRMLPADTEDFYCDLRTLDWQQYFLRYWMGIRIYILNDSQFTVEAAEKRAQRFKMATFGIAALLLSVFVYYVYRIMSSIFGF